MNRLQQIATLSGHLRNTVERLLSLVTEETTGDVRDVGPGCWVPIMEALAQSTADLRLTNDHIVEITRPFVEQ